MEITLQAKMGPEGRPKTDFWPNLTSNLPRFIPLGVEHRLDMMLGSGIQIASRTIALVLMVLPTG